MTDFYVIFVAGIAVVGAVGAWILATTPTQAPWFQNVFRRFTRIRDVCVEQLGRYIAAVAIVLAGAAAAVIISWPFGRFARRFVSDIDTPFLHWTQSHVVATGTWHHLNSIVTNMGNRPVIKILVPAAAVILAVLWRRRGWWIPLLVIPLSYVFEKFGQSVLAKVADRPVPVPALSGFGSYPSGGCARLLVVYGVIWYMVVLTFPSMSRRVRVLGFIVVAQLAFIEGYTRIFLIKHYGLDVVGGWLYGALMMLAFIAAASCFKQRPEVDAPRESADVPRDVVSAGH